MEEPKFVDVIRNEDGTANWRLNFDNIYQAYNSALFHFQWQERANPVLIEYLIRLRLRAKEDKDYKKADEIRSVLDSVGVELRDTPTHIEWHISCSAVFGKVSITDF